MKILMIAAAIVTVYILALPFLKWYEDAKKEGAVNDEN